MPAIAPAKETQALVDIAQRAGEAILRVYETDFDVAAKGDQSPLTQADLAAHRIIVAELEALDPQTPVISEEAALPPFETRAKWRRFYLVDPLDGTKEFIKRNGDFTVNIALIEDHQPVRGVVGVPVHDRVYTGGPDGAWRLDGAHAEPIHTRLLPHDAITIVASRSHRDARLEAYLAAVQERFKRAESVAIGSSLKFCLLAEGKADFYPRLGPTAEWDTAAAHAVLAAAGGAVTLLDGKPLIYNAKESLLNPFFLAIGDTEFPWDNLPLVAGDG